MIEFGFAWQAEYPITTYYHNNNIIVKRSEEWHLIVEPNHQYPNSINRKRHMWIELITRTMTWHQVPIPSIPQPNMRRKKTHSIVVIVGLFISACSAIALYENVCHVQFVCWFKMCFIRTLPFFSSHSQCEAKEKKNTPKQNNQPDSYEWDTQQHNNRKISNNLIRVESRIFVTAAF